jgi:phenylalanyl-tRNA synthetase beta chain
MQFLLSWLADYVDLGQDLLYQVDDRGRHSLARLTGAERRNAFQLGERLTAIGLAVEGYPIAILGALQEPKLDVEVTSNRPDCMCHLGLARELAVALDVPLRRPEAPLYGSLSSDGTSGTVILEDPDACPRFVSRVIRGVRIGPSPEWLRRRLEALGLRSINNVVDATNFVLWELGQPLHAYDLATVPGGELRVRRARRGEKLVTLDGVERALDPEILVIADRQRAVGLAGIMGGLATEVTARTTDVLLESAHFDRRRIRNGARQLALHTDASHRFERGADFGVCDEASRRCAALIVEFAGGEIVEPALDAVARRPERVAWELTAGGFERFVGCTVGDDEVERVLGGLGFAPRRAGERRWQGEVPPWRAVDFEPRRGAAAASGGPLAHAQDLYEEVLRHVGFERAAATLPALGGVDAGRQSVHDLRGRVQTCFAGLGFAEAIHFAFHDRAADDRLPVLVRTGEPLALANPLSERHAVLRRSLVPNLVGSAEFNAHRGAPGVRLFEVGRLFPGGSEPEVEALAAVAGGESGSPWDHARALDLLSLKGTFEALFEELGAPGLATRPATLPGVLEGTGAHWLTADGEVVGWFGRLASTETPFELAAAEIRLDRLPVPERPRAVEAPSRFPGVVADLTLTHALEISWAELAAAIRSLGVEHLTGFRLKDRYQGTGVPAGAVATTITFEYNARERSLTQEEVNDRQAALAAELERRFAVAREARP